MHQEKMRFHPKQAILTLFEHSQLRPDILITNKDQKKIMIVDVTVPFENRTLAFRDAKAQKVEKYAPLAKTLRAKGYQVQTNVLIFRWDPSNKRVLWDCGIGQRYAQLIRQLMVSDAIRWLRDIYLEHITGHWQYQER
ncbi:hypothetical protein KIL84_011053 [Mauremys mutica]|uniref:Uncharacterized protein n=1 Tax=Mauremys mutica TaxID=74926 RepID=A0A9D3XCX4_9SAUR|nr:hypothetical protein KIL84_011053 [Mauremys mutica]